MEKFITGDAVSQISEYLESMVNDVNVLLFTDASEASQVTEQILKELAELNSKIKIETLAYNGNSLVAKGFDLHGAPSFALLNDKNEKVGVTFHGVPLGHEINSLLSGLIDVSGAPILFDQDTIDYIKSIDQPVDIKVFVTMQCPHCPGAVSTAHRIALLNPNIKASMYEAQTFNNESIKYQVSSVPKIIINETKSFLGNQPVSQFVETLKSL